MWLILMKQYLNMNAQKCGSEMGRTAAYTYLLDVNYLQINNSSKFPNTCCI